MSNLAPLMGFLAGAVVVGGIWFLMAESGAPAPTTYDDDPLGAAALHGGADTDARLARIERRLDDLVTALDPRGAPAATGPELATRAPDGPATEAGRGGMAPQAVPVITDEVLDKTLERMADRRFAKMTPAQLRAEAQRLMRQAKDPNAARAVLDRLLARDLEPDERGQVLTELGSVHRSLGDHAASEKALREAMRTAGMDTETGIKAGYHLVWTYSRAEQKDKALAMADELIANRDAPESFRPWLRWAGARMALEAGDQTRALRDYRALLEDVKDKQQYRQILRDAADKVKQLDAGPR
ncbi:MAG: tetratricopeptide repeat protein [Planctomycetota bacterium]|nr:tetratricopeptide repeat protein [Planctomycetota bacterium]